MAAGRSINYQINFNANTQQAKAQIDSLFASVNKLASQPTQIVNVSSLKEGVRTAQQLQAVLQKSVDTTTGDLNLSQFSTQMKNAGLTVTQLASKLNALGPEGAQAFGQLTTAVANAQISVKRTTTLLDSFLATLKHTAQYQLSTTMLNAFIGSIHSAISYVKNLDEALTNISVVTGMSDAKLANFASRAQSLGKELKASTLEVANAALIYFQQGDSMAAAMEKATITMKAANVSFNSSAKQMSEYLTAVWNSYQVGADQLEHYVDIMAALGSKTATSMEEIAAAMKKVAATANTVGVSFDQMSSIISTVSSVTREAPESIGTAFKTILARMGDLKVGNLTEDGVSVTLGSVSSQLKKIGVNILSANGEMRDMGTIIEEIGTKWQGFNSAQKAALAQAIAGKRQYTQMMALFENFGDYQNNLKIAENSDGALEEMQGRWATSWEAAANRVQNAMQGIWSSLINNKAVTASLNVIADLTNGIGALIEKMGGIVPIITMIGTAFGAQLGGKAQQAVTAVKDRIAMIFGKDTSNAKKIRQDFLKQYEKGNITGTQLQHAQKNLTLQQRYDGMKDKLTQDQRDKWKTITTQLQEAQGREVAAEAEMDKARIKRLSGDSRVESITDLSTSGIQKNLDKIRQNYDKKKTSREKDRSDFDYDKQSKELTDKYEKEQRHLRGQVTKHTNNITDLNRELGGHTGAKKRIDAKLNEIAEKKKNGQLTEEEIAEEENFKKRKAEKEEKIADIQKQIAEHAKQKDENQKKLAKSQQDQEKEQEKLDARKAQNDKIDEKDKEKYEQQKKEQKLAMAKDLAKVGISSDYIGKNDNGTSLIDEFFSEDKTKAQKAGEKIGELYKEAVAKGISNKSQNTSILNKGKVLSNLFAGGDKSDKAKEQIVKQTTDLLTGLNETGENEDYNQQILSHVQRQIGNNENLKNMITASKDEAGKEILTFNVEFQVNEKNLGEVLDALNTVTDQYDNDIDKQQASQIELGDQYVGEQASEGFKAQIESAQQEDIAREAKEQAQEDQKELENEAKDEEPETTLADSFVAVGTAIGSAYSMLTQFKGALDVLNSDATPTEKLAAGFTALIGVVASANTLFQSAVTITKGLATAQKVLNGTKIAETGLEKLLIALKNKSIITSMKNNAIKLVEIVRTEGLAKALGKVAVKLTAIQVAGGPLLWVVLAISAAVVGLVYATGKIIEAINKADEARPTVEKYAEAVERNVESANSLKTALQTVASTLHDTSLAYDEQLAKINEATAAYGVQMSMLELLSGNYGAYETRLRRAAAAKAALNAQEAQKAYEGATKLVNEDKDLQAIFDKGSLKNQASLVNDAAFEKWKSDEWLRSWGYKVDHNNAEGLINQQTLNTDNYQDYLSAEGKQYDRLNSILSEFGVQFNHTTLRLEKIADQDIKYDELLEFLQDGERSGLNFWVNDKTSFTYEIIQALKEGDVGKLLGMKNNGRELAQQQVIIGDSSFDMLNLSEKNKDLSDLTPMLKNLQKSKLLESADDYASIADFLAGFSGYQNVSNQITALSELVSLAAPSIKLRKQSKKDVSEIEAQMMDDLIQSLGSEYTVDVLLKIQPTDIILDEDGHYTIEKQAKEYAEARVNAEKAEAKSAALQEQKSTLTGATFSRSSYSTLKDSKIFDTEEELQDFMKQGQAERIAKINKMELDASNTEIKSQEQVIQLAEQRAEADHQLISDAEKKIVENFMETDSSQFKDSYSEEVAKQLEDIDTEKLSQGDIVRAINNIYDTRSAEANAYANLMKAIDEKQFGETTAEGFDWEAAWKNDAFNFVATQQGWSKNTDKAHMLEYLVDSGDNGLRKEKERAQTDVANLESNYLSDYVNYQTALGNEESIINKAQDSIDAEKMWQEVGLKIQQATNKAEAYASAIGKLGNIDTSDLAYITTEDPTVLDKYQNLTTEDWNKYVYEQAQKQYDQLLQMYKKDSLDYALVLDEKKNLTENYYKTLQDAAKQAAELQEKEWDKIIKGAESAISAASSMSSGKVTFESLEDLRAGLDAAGVSAERIEEIINRISNAKGNKEQIRASMVAEAEAALAKLGAESAEVQEYKGLVTELDTSLVDGTEINIKADVENSQDVTNEISTAINGADSSVHVEAETDDMGREIKRAVDNADGTKTITMDNGSTFTGEVSQAVDNADGTVTVTLDNGSKVNISDNLSAAIKTGTHNGYITLQLGNGTDFSGEIKSVLHNPDDAQIYHLQLADDSEFETNVSAAFGIDEKTNKRIVTLGLDEQNIFTISEQIAGIFANKDKEGNIIGWKVKLADGSIKDITAQIETQRQELGEDGVIDIDALLNIDDEQLTDLDNNLKNTRYIDVVVRTDTKAIQAQQYKDTVLANMNNGEFQEYITYAAYGKDTTGLNKIFDSDIGDARWSKNLSRAQRVAIEDFYQDIISNNKYGESIDAKTGEIIEGSILDILFQKLGWYLENGNDETKNFARMLLQGLGEGLKQYAPDFDFEGYLKGLGGNVYSTFQRELLIFSPSRLTKALAPYLFEGLAVGIKEANEAFEVPELTGLAEKIAKGFEAEIGKIDFSKDLDELLNDNGLKEKFNQAGFTDEDFTTYVAGGYATYNEEDFKNSDFFKQEVNKRLAQKHQGSPWLLPLNLNKFSKIVADYPVPEISVEEIKATEEEVLQDYRDNSLSLLQTYTDSWFSDTKWNSSSEWTNFEKNVMNDAMAATLKKYNATRYEDISPEEQDAFVEDFYKNIEASAKKALNAVKKTWASIKDTWLNGLKELYTADEETAQKTYTLWENTFKAIATARQSILEGKTPIEGMFGDTSALSTIVESYLNAGNKIEDIRDILTGNDVTKLIFEPFDFENYRNSGNQRYLNTDKDGTQFTDTSVEDYNENVNKEVQSWMNSDSRNAFMAEILTPDKLASLASGTTEEQKMLEELITTGVVNKTEGKDGAADSYSFNKSTQATVSQEIVDMLAKSLYLSTQKEVNNVLSTAWTEVAAQRYNIADSGRTTAEAAIAKQQSDLDAIQKAKELKLQGKDLDSLTSDEKRAVLRLTGAKDLASVSLDSLNSAASKCANMIANLADTMAQAMYLIQNGQADTFEIGADGKVTAYQYNKEISQSQLEEYLANKGYHYDPLADNFLDDDNNIITQKELNDAFKELHTKKIELTGDKANVTGSTVDSGQAAVEDLKKTARDSAASSAGMSAEEFDDYTARLYEILDTTGKAFSALDETETQAFYNLTAKIKLAEDGFSALQATSKDTWKILNKQTKVSTSEYSKTLSAMKSNMSKIFGVDLKKLTNKFVEDHLDELHKMATGTEKEAIAAQDAIQDDLVAAFMETEGLDATVTINVDGVPTAIDILGLFQNQLDQWDGEDIGFTITPNIAPALNSMQSLVDAGTMTADQITEALEKVGWEPDITYEQFPLSEDAVAGTYATVKDSAGNSHTVQITDQMISKQMITIPVIGSAKKISPPGGGPRPNLSGGGGSKAKKLDKKDPEDEIERYHHVNKTLDRLSNQLDEVDKKKSRIYGKSYLDYISQEIALTEKQCDTYQRYIDEAKEYLKLDTERVVSLGAIFDEYGNIANYDQVMQNILDAYNAFIDEYNAMDADTQQSEEVEQRKEDWDKWYDEKKKWIENYEETVQTIYEQNNNLLDAQNKISEKMLEGIQYKVEIHVELTDAEKEYLDYVNDKYEEILMKQGEAMSNLVKETDLTVSNLAALGKEKEELDAAFASGKLNQANYVDGLKDLNSQVLDNLSTLQELKTSIEELYGTTLETATSDFDKQTAKVKAASEAMSSYISILALVGKGSNLKELTKFYDSQYQYNLQSLQMQQEYLNTLKKEEQYYLERMDSAEGLTETERKQYEALEETLNNVQSNILSDTQSTLQAIAEAFNNEVEIIISDLEKMIAGSDSSLQDLADAYSYYQEEQGRYVTSARELYEVNKLNRNIEKTMATTTSTVNKNLLAALQERINKQSEENELTEYNVEMNQLQYELLLKKIALEEAQNAKNTVRLTRDAGGNYVYQYTANQEDILSKEQEYEDVLQQINDLSVNRVRDLESQLLQIYQNTTQKMREIAEDQTLTEEEKYAKIQTLMDQFKEQTNYIQEQYNIASAHLIKSNEVISEHYNKALVEHSQNAENGLNQTIAKMIENTQQFQQAMEDACTNKIPSAMDQMKDRIDSVTETTNSSYGSMADSLDNYNKVAEDAVDQNNKIADGLENEVLPAIHDITTAWDEYATKLKEVINVYEEMYQTIIKTLQAQGKLSNAEELKSQVPNQGNSSPNGGSTVKTPDTKKPDTPSSNNGGGGGGGGNNPANGAGTGGTNANTLSIIYKALVTTGPSKGTSGGGVPIGPSTLKVGSTGTIKWNCADGYVQGGSEVSDPALAQISGNTITALAAGSVTVTLKYWDRNKTSEFALSIINGIKHQLEPKKADKVYGYATGGIADFTGPAWLDGTKSKPELVLSASDTQNILATVESVRKLDSSTLRLLNSYIANASLAMTFGLSNMSAQSVLGGADTLRQDVHITAEFPNATNSQEIEDAFDSLINRAAQFITTKN